MIYDLVLEGNGTKSMAFLGVLRELEARGHTYGRLLGTSAGGIAAAMLACGYTSQEAANMMYNEDTQQPTFVSFLSEPSHTASEEIRKGALRELLRKHNSPLIPDLVEEQIDSLLFDIFLRSPLFYPLLSFLEQGYWYSDRHFLEWLEQILDTGSFRGTPRRFSKMTLAEFYQATESELSLVVSDITASHVLILNHRTAPHCPLIWALRMSAGLPIVWEDVKWQDAWGTYLERDITNHRIVEGEIFSPFPIELFLSDLPQVLALVGPKHADDVLGIVIDDSIPVPNAPPLLLDESWAAIEQLPAANSLAHLFDAVLQTRSKLTIEEVQQHIVHLPAKGYRTLEFHLTIERFNALVAAGRESMQRYFEQRNADVVPINRDMWVPPSPSAIQYVNDSARQQLSYIGVVNHYYNVDVRGGMHGSVIAGRDAHGIHIRSKPIEERYDPVLESPALRSLRTTLSMLYESESDARRIAQDSGIDTRHVNFSTKSVNFWHDILSQAHVQDKVKAMVATASFEYPAKAAEMRQAYTTYENTLESQ